MTVQDAIDILMDVENKNSVLVIPSEIGFVSACVTESGVGFDESGNPVFVMIPCFCNLRNKTLTIDLKADDFDIVEN